jgi:hypothetical protein
MPEERIYGKECPFRYVVHCTMHNRKECQRKRMRHLSGSVNAERFNKENIRPK